MTRLFLRHYIIVLLALAGACGTSLLAPAAAHAQSSPMDPKSAPTKEQVTKAISDFVKEPLSPEGIEAAEVIAKYAKDSPDCWLNLTQPILAFAGSDEGDADPLMQYRRLLFVAFLAGNIQPQVQKGTVKDHSYDGVLQVIKTYDQLRAQNPKLEIKLIEEFRTKEKGGQLKQWVEDTVAKETAKGGSQI
ncbi:MAG: hypothetical protein ACAI35_04265 [Candidatus Methylacidiphilales bacterium]|nr:hypothetical protein [Candidatus Methylacidiphilales bacterium]